MIRRLFNNRWFVVALAVCSLGLMVRSVVTPFFDEPDFADAEDPEFYLAGEMTDAADAEDEPVIRVTGRSVLSGQLTWNDSPRRDPYSRGGQAAAPSALSASAEPVRSTSGLPRLDALVAGPDSLLAVLDDHIVREGDAIGNFRVARIRADGVRLVSSRGSHWLSVADMNLTPEPALPTRVDDAADALAGLTDIPEPGG